MSRSSPSSSSSSSSPPSASSPYLSLLFFVLLCGLVSALGGASTSSEVQPGGWYDRLRKPWFNPPKLAFPIVWTVLYGCMAIAAWRMWEKKEAAAAAAGGQDSSTGKGRRDASSRSSALLLWFVQLGVNCLWSPVFFGLHQLGWGLLIILTLLVLLFACIRAFARVDAAASRLFWPYAMWVGYATMLNASIWQLNPQEA